MVQNSVWNGVDIIESFLMHQQMLGATSVFVMDYGSTDGTRDILNSSRWSHFVEVLESAWFGGDELLHASSQGYPATLFRFMDFVL